MCGSIWIVHLGGIGYFGCSFGFFAGQATEAQVVCLKTKDLYQDCCSGYMARVLPLFLLIITTFSGCFLFRKAITELPFETTHVPGGAYMMGDFHDNENEDATPLHRVIVGPFDISTYEITYEQYDLYALEAGIELPEDNGYGRGPRAVVNITWDEASEYCVYYGFRLPSEQEWEYAARDTGQERRYPGTNNEEEVDKYVRHIDNSVAHSFAVGTKMPNELGLYDMGGNVFEWVGDYYEFYPGPGTDPAYKDLENFSMRIIRGGSFKMGLSVAQTWWRSGTLGEITSDNIGFRCARSIQP